MEFVLIAIAIVVVALIATVGLLVGRGRRLTRLDEDAAPRHDADPPAPAAGAAVGRHRLGAWGRPRTPDRRPPRSRRAPPGGRAAAGESPEPGGDLRDPAALGRPAGAAALSAGPLAVLAGPRAAHRCSTRERLDRGDWEEVEETLLAADVGVAADDSRSWSGCGPRSMVLATASGRPAARAAGAGS